MYRMDLDVFPYSPYSYKTPKMLLTDNVINYKIYQIIKQ